MKFRRRGFIEAIQWQGDFEGFDKIAGWCAMLAHQRGCELPALTMAHTAMGAKPIIELSTLERVLFAVKGDWIVLDQSGFWPCKPDIFEATYEPAE